MSAINARSVAKLKTGMHEAFIFFTGFARYFSGLKRTIQLEFWCKFCRTSWMLQDAQSFAVFVI